MYHTCGIPTKLFVLSQYFRVLYARSCIVVVLWLPRATPTGNILITARMQN